MTNHIDPIIGAAAILLGPQSTFVTGSDLLVDGGVIAAASTATGWRLPSSAWAKGKGSHGIRQ